MKPTQYWDYVRRWRALCRIHEPMKLALKPCRKRWERYEGKREIVRQIDQNAT